MLFMYLAIFLFLNLKRPSIPQNVQNSILAHLLSLLETIVKHRVAAAQEKRKRKTAEYQAKKESKRRKVESSVDATQVQTPSTIDLEMTISPASHRVKDSNAVAPAVEPMDLNEAGKIDTEPAESSQLSQHIVIGINNVSRYLEDQMKHLRTAVMVSSSGVLKDELRGSFVRPLDVVFVCKGDVDPPILISHLVQLVASYNSTLRGRTLSQDNDLKPILIVPLAKGAEEQLAKALSIRRVATFAFDV
jgi:ribonuclease P/MRP protein subunit POP3